MKKIFLTLLATASMTTMANTMDEMRIDQLDTMSGMNYRSLVTRVELQKDLTLDLSEDDDIYFQNGNVLKEAQIDKSKSYCQLDTDVTEDSYTSEYITLNGDNLTLKKGLVRAIENTTVSPNFNDDSIEYDINFIRSVVSSNTQLVDELECNVPLTKKKPLTVKDVKEITGNAFSFDLLDIEGN